MCRKLREVELREQDSDRLCSIYREVEKESYRIIGLQLEIQSLYFLMNHQQV